MNNILKKEKRLLLIRPDLIGDYVLFRNFIKILKQSERYKDYKITLLGNFVYENLAKNIDLEYLDEFIPLNRLHYKYNPFYKLLVNYKLNQKKFDILINPVYSRDYHITESIIKSVNAEEKIGNAGDLTNITGGKKTLADDFYTRIIPAKNEVMFEFLRNKEFFENLLQEEININKPFIEPGSYKSKIKPPKNKYVVICPGASRPNRQWNPENFAGIADFLAKEKAFNILICGSKKDKIPAKQIQKLAKNTDTINLCGKTSLMDLSYVLQNAEFVMSGDTSFYHIAVAVDTKVICLSNGNTFKRFIPYPKEITELVTCIFPPQIEENLCNTDDLVEKYKYASTLDINLITVDKVKEVITEWME